MDLRLLLGWNGLWFALFAVLLALFLLSWRKHIREHISVLLARSVGLALMMVSLVVSHEPARSRLVIAGFVLFWGAWAARLFQKTPGEASTDN